MYHCFVRSSVMPLCRPEGPEDPCHQRIQHEVDAIQVDAEHDRRQDDDDRGAYTSLRLGQVTRPISLRTSARKRLDRPIQPVMLSFARPPNESSCSAIAVVFISQSLSVSSSQFSVPRNATRKRVQLATGGWLLTTSHTLAGQEGIEPPTPGFGDRCSAN